MVRLIVCAGLMGVILVLGASFLQDAMLAWFISPDAYMNVVRLSILAVLLVMLIVAPLYDNVLVRAIWGIVGVSLAGYGYAYFLDNPAFIFDYLFIALSAVCAGLAAITTTGDAVPIVRPAIRSVYMRARGVTMQAGLLSSPLNHSGTLGVVNWQNMQDRTHRLEIGRNLSA